MEREIIIRSAVLNDVKGIHEVHVSDPDPWADIVECSLWVNHRLLRGFHIDVAVVNGHIVGHAEWILSEEPKEKFLYLGMLEIHPDYRRQGIGKAMIEKGIERAKELNCPFISTISETDAAIFYEKLGFTVKEKIWNYSLHINSIEGISNLEPTGNKVPYEVIEKYPLEIGLAQGSSRHMWEIVNRPVPIYGDELFAPAFCEEDEYVQLRYWEDSESALVVVWTEKENLDSAIEKSIILAASHQIKFLDFNIREKYKEEFERKMNASSSSYIEIIKLEV